VPKKLNATGSGRLVEQWKHCSEHQGDFARIYCVNDPRTFTHHCFNGYFPHEAQKTSSSGFASLD